VYLYYRFTYNIYPNEIITIDFGKPSFIEMVKPGMEKLTRMAGAPNDSYVSFGR